MKEIEYIDDWRKVKNAEIIDVRSPSEFNNDHIPGSINIPILNDQQRHDENKGQLRAAAGGHDGGNVGEQKSSHQLQQQQFRAHSQ